MKPSEIRAKAKEEILEELQGCRRELFNLRFQRQSEGIENPSQLRRLRKDIARLQTILREMELGLRRPAASQASEAK
ncbi:MAG: 50S ribosomal protein L29 [Planctomycetes bacterium]|nr:50S ribosomal protein L29 [Planctomycetota bacterium]MBM4078479.1 50S ribosomal protein L29 [Planctomycetota bacterium]MBM4083177.1 50S ribosomal protein L29 [Planctomycetota bacterium]